MALSYKARRRWSLVILLIGLPAYIVVAVTITNLFDRPPLALELAIYVILGIVWALPFRAVFRGVGKHDPAEVISTIAPTLDATKVDETQDDTKKAE